MQALRLNVLRTVLSVALLALTLALAARQASAQQTTVSPAKSDYEIALSSALDAHARGDYEAARMFMERAHALEPSARTLRGLAIVAFAQARHFEAIRFLDQALASEVKALPDDLRQASEELLAHAWAQVGRFEVVIDPPSGDFMIDGEAPTFYDDHTIVLKPGPHLLTARAKARAPYELSLEVRPGDHRTLQLVLAVPPAAEVVEKVVYAPAKAPGPRAEPQRELSPLFYTPRVRWAALGAGGTLLIGGVTLWGIGYSRLLEVDDRCRDMEPAGCTSKEARRRYDSRNVGSFAIASGVLTGVGAATLLTVGALELWQRRHKKRNLEVRASATSLTLSGQF